MEISSLSLNEHRSVIKSPRLIEWKLSGSIKAKKKMSLLLAKENKIYIDK